MRKIQDIKKIVQTRLQEQEKLSEKIKRIEERMKENIFCSDIATEILELTQNNNSPNSQHKPLHDNLLQDDYNPPQDDDKLLQDDDNLNLLNHCNTILNGNNVSNSLLKPDTQTPNPIEDSWINKWMDLRKKMEDITSEFLEPSQKAKSPTSQHRPLHDKLLQDDDKSLQDVDDDDNLLQDENTPLQDDNNLLQDEDTPPQDDDNLLQDDDNLLQDDDNRNLQNAEGPFDNPFHNYVFHKYEFLQNVYKPNLQINKRTEDQEDGDEGKNYIPTQVVTNERHEKLHHNLNLQNVEVSTFNNSKPQTCKTGTQKLMWKLTRKRNLSEMKWNFYLENWNTASDINMKIIIPKDWNSKEEIIRNLFLDSQTKLQIRTFQDRLIEGGRKKKTDDDQRENQNSKEYTRGYSKQYSKAYSNYLHEKENMIEDKLQASLATRTIMANQTNDHKQQDKQSFYEASFSHFSTKNSQMKKDDQTISPTPNTDIDTNEIMKQRTTPKKLIETNFIVVYYDQKTPQNIFCSY